MLNVVECIAMENQDFVRPRPWWIDLCFVIAGLGCDWYYAFDWFSGKNSIFSEPVLSRLGLIVVLCATGAFLVVCLVRRAKPRDAMAVFGAASLLLSGNLAIWR